MQQLRPFLWAAALLIAIPTGYFAIEMWRFGNGRPPQIHILQDFSTDLPAGGSITYRNQSRERITGPGDAAQLLIWIKPDGKTQEYLISQNGGGYADIEFRMRQDRQALWLASRSSKQIIATLDLNNERLTSYSGTLYKWTEDGPQKIGVSGHPQWAKLDTGYLLNHKEFP